MADDYTGPVKSNPEAGEMMNKALMALIAGSAMVAGAAVSAMCADIVGAVLNANGSAVPGAKVSTSTQAGQSIGSAVTDGRGDYAISNVPPGLYYLTLAPPPGSDLRGQSVASYVSGMGLTVNWGVTPGRDPIASAMPGISNRNPGASTVAFAAQPEAAPKRPKKSVKRKDDDDEGGGSDND